MLNGFFVLEVKVSKDPAFLFYPNDWLGGTSTFTRSQKGAYMDLLMAQFNQFALTLEDIRVVLREDFDLMWEKKLKSKFDTESNGVLFYNARLREEVIKRKAFTESRRNNKAGKNQYSCGHMTNHKTSHMENRDENGNFDTSTLNKTTIPNKAIEFNFEDVWSLYPKRCGKKDALRHFKASVKNEDDFDNIRIALNNYLASERVFNDYIQNGSTWFNNWRDWINYKEELCKRCLGKGKYVSSTGYESICSCPRGNKARIGKQ